MRHGRFPHLLLTSPLIRRTIGLSSWLKEIIRNNPTAPRSTSKPSFGPPPTRCAGTWTLGIQARLPRPHFPEIHLHRMTPEEKARQQIDAQLTASGWAVQTKDKINLSAARGVAVCELSFATGEPDYTLFVDAKALGTVEAKAAGHSLTGVEEQSTKYVTGVPAGLPAWHNPLPFCYETTGEETRFTNRLDPEPRSRNVFAFHRPETLLAWVQQEKQLSQRLKEFPPLARAKLWPAQSTPSSIWKNPLPPVAHARSSRWPPDRARRSPPLISFIAS